MKQSTRTSRYRYLLRYALPYWRGWAVIVAVTFLMSALAVLQPWPMKLLMDNVLGGAPLGVDGGNFVSHLRGATSRAGLLAWIVGAGLAIFALNAALEVVLTWSWIRVGQRMVYDLAADLFAHVQRRSLLFHSRNSVGESMSRITGDSWCAYRLVDMLVLSPLQAVITLACMLVLMLRMDVGLTLVSVAVVPLMAGSSVLLGRPLRAVARLRRDIEGRIQSHVHQTLSAIPVVQVFNQEQRQRQQFEEHAAEAIRAHGRNVMLGSIGGLVTGSLPTLGTAAVLWFGAHRVLAGSLSLGALLVFLAYLRGLQLNAAKLTGSYATLQEINASVERVFELLEVQHEVRESPRALHLARRAGGDVRFEDVTFGYDPARPPVLRGLSLSVAAGETVALVGGSGAGKSTLAALVPRLFDPWSGSVLLDGHDVRGLTLASLRAQVSLVLQEPFLFPISVADNIAYGRPGATADQIEAAARAAGAHGFIARLPRQYGTVIGERGATLSGGERQRLSIARALLRDAPVLILDEPTSALDAATEASVLEALRGLRGGRTTLLIAHRLSAVRDADRIVVLAQGALVEQGTHDQLLRHDGIYATLFRSQMDESTEALATATAK